MSEALATHLRCTDDVIKRLNAWDVGLVKLSCIAFGLLLARLYPSVLAGPAWSYAAAVLLLGLPTTFRLYPLYAAARVRDRRNQALLE